MTPALMRTTYLHQLHTNPTVPFHHGLNTASTSSECDICQCPTKWHPTNGMKCPWSNLTAKDLARLRHLMVRFCDYPSLWKAFLHHTGVSHMNGMPKIAFRNLDWFVINYCSTRSVSGNHNPAYGPPTDVDVVSDIHGDYKTRLKFWHKEFFDPFKRGIKVLFHPNGPHHPDAVQTSLCQLNYFTWALTYGVLEACQTHLTEVESQRQKATYEKRLRDARSKVHHEPPSKRRRLVDCLEGKFSVCTSPITMEWNDNVDTSAQSKRQDGGFVDNLP